MSAFKKVLIVEDDQSIIDLLTIHLRDMGYAATPCLSGREALRVSNYDIYDLILLDVMLPDNDGFELCRAFRKDGYAGAIIMLTAKAEEIDKVLGLELGADDYITKPFSVRELIARIKAVTRRVDNARSDQTIGTDHIMQFGDLEIDVEKRKASLSGVRLDLSKKEFEILSLLASNPGKSFTRTRILNLIWGYDFDGFEHTVNSHINRLRSKIEEDMSNPQFILTSWGVGYRFNEDL